MIPTCEHAKTVFLQALELPAAERAAYVNAQCGEDPALRREVDDLLEHHAQMADSFLAADLPSPPWGRGLGDAGGEGVTLDQISERVGTVIGPYKLLEQIGEGGFGVVFMAEQTAPVRRKVALKILKPGMDTRQVIARFEAERQALALMDHANIAHIFDGGTTSGEPGGLSAGRPYFVMELVRGIPITDFCDVNHLPVRTRLELFVSICQAVQHAHQKGIIHRDIKPTNVLVTLHDGTPVVKVIDFGIAKARGQQLTEKTLFTNFAQMIGTPLYMSPEQAEMSGLDVDTRTDIYALGVLLYELLTGTTPLDKGRLREASYDEVRRLIREEEPVKPSTRISTLGQAATTVSANRQSNPKKLSQFMRGELDWIVMKALEKDRNRRYESASALAADVQRYLHDEPVQACPPSAWYWCRKLVRRNKRVAVMAGFVAALLVVAAGVFAVSYGQIKEALQNETQAKADLERTVYYQRIGLAASARANEQAGRAEELLEQCPPHLRGWEWHYLKRLPFVDFPVLRLPGVITKVAVSRDGRLLASGNAAVSNTTIKIWDLQTGAELRELKKHVGFIRGLAFSPDGRLLATGDHRTVKIWNPFTGDLLRELPENASVLNALIFSPDGRFLATACQDEGVRLWDITSWRQLVTIPEKSVAFNGGLSFSPDGRMLRTANAEGIVKVHDAATGQTSSSFQGNIQWVFSAAFSSDGRLVALGSQEGTIKVWETDTGKEIHSLEAHIGVVMGLAFLDGERRLASCGDDRTLKIWDLATGQEALQLGVFPKRSQALAVSADGLRLFYRRAEDTGDTIGVADGTPLTEPGTAAGTLVLNGHVHIVVGVAWSPDGRRLASASWDKTVNVWDASTGREQFTLRGHQASLTDVTFSPDGRLIASASWDETVRVWDAETGQELLALRGEGGPVHGVAFHPRDGRVLASAHRDGTIKLWDPTTGQRKRCNIPAQKNSVLGVAFSPDGALLAGAAGNNGGNIPVWNAASGAQQHTLQRKEPGICFSLAFSPNGRFVAGSATTNDVYLWDLATDEVRGKLTHPLRPNRVAFSPDGCRLVTVSMDQTVRLWDVLTDQKPVELRGHVGDVWCAAFSPDGRRLATGAGYKGHGEIRIREAASWEKKP